MLELRPLGGQGFVEELGVERAIALVVTVELEVRLTEPVVPLSSVVTAACNVLHRRERDIQGSAQRLQKFQETTR